MNGQTRLLVGLAILGLGAGTFWLASTQAQADVRQVGEVLGDPAAHTNGRFTLVGVPEPASIPITSSQGVVLAANPEWSNRTSMGSSWTRDGTHYYSTIVLGVEAQGDGRLHWTLRNETRLSPADTTLAFPAQQESWFFGSAGEAFPVQGFEDGPGTPPRIWALYDKSLEHAMQPKPSQFRGHLLAALPDGTPVPTDARIWIVDEYTAGCSSKFLPPEAQAKYNVTA